MQTRFLDPKVLATIADLHLTAKTVVDGFIAGLHRSPDFGFSQEFAEYRSYTVGDDLRYVDWNVFARTERAYLKRYRGETNTRVTILLDRSRSMAFKGRGIKKIDYARFAAASIGYLAHIQRDAIGAITFDDDVRDYVAPSSRQGQFQRVLHVLDRAEPGQRTDFARPFLHFQEWHRYRGIAVVLSDFYAEPELVAKTIAPLRHRGNDVLLFHVLDPDEIRPKLDGPRLLVDLETQETLEVSPEYAAGEYARKMDAHCAELKREAEAAGLSYMLLDSSRPLDAALREYLSLRQGRM